MMFKFKTKEEKEQIKRDKKLLKAEQKRREAIHNDLVMRDILSRKEEKVAKEGYIISLKDVNKVYPNHVQAVYDFSLDIKENEFIVFVGPSGCGKSTTLRMIAGLEDITCGDLFINGKYANDIEAKHRDIAMVFQNYALYPNMNVYQNMGFSLLMHHHKKEEIDQKVKAAAEILGLTDLLDRKPAALSGGQRQRVALGRAIVRNSKIFLMDEPLSNLDAKLRVQMRSEIVNIHKRIGATTIYVTHDQTEAMTMADRIVVMNKGVIQQIGTPKDIYNNPVNKFVATFIGSPAMNILKATYDSGVIKFDNGYEIALNKEQVLLHDNFYQKMLEDSKKEIADYEALKEKVDPKKDAEFLLLVGQEMNKLTDLISRIEEIIASKTHEIELGVRSEDIHSERLKDTISHHSEPFEVNIDLCELLGNQYFVYTKFNGENLLSSHSSDESEIATSSDIKLVFNLDRLHLFDTLFEKSIF